MEFPSGFTLLSFFSMTFFILYKFNEPVKYYSKFIIYCGCCMLLAAFFIPYFCFRPKNIDNFLIYAKIIKHLTKVLGIKWTLRGGENLNRNKSFIIVANHQSCLDIMGMYNIWNVIQRMTVIAKKGLLFAIPFGPAAYLAGLIFIDRRSDKGKEAMNNAMKKLKKDNTKLWIFPEGTRRSTNEIHPFKKGAFHTAIDFKIPIVPVVFSSYRHIIDHEKRTFGSGEMIINALPEIPTDGLTFDDMDSLMEQTKQQMSKVFKDISAEVDSSSRKTKF